MLECLVLYYFLKGHAIAAGTAFAIGCDYRIMAEEDYLAGLTVIRMVFHLILHQGGVGVGGGLTKGKATTHSFETPK